MPVFGLDISHHQDLALDLARAKREGISFVFIKATEGNTFLDSEFAANLAEARRAGLQVAAYHYVRASAGAALQVAWISRHVPKDVPVILDVEANSGAIALTRDLVARLKAAGYRVPLLYLPRWYWQQIGSPSLVGLPPLWSSRYPDNVVGTIADEWADVPAHYWDGYGGLPVAVLQFTSSAAIAGHQPLDANAYRGTPQQLAALLGGTPQQEDDMQLTDRVDWAKINELGPDFLGHKILGTWQHAAATRALTAQVLSVVTNDPDITPERLDESVDKAIAAHMPTAEQTAAALLPLVEDIAGRVLGADNKAVAGEILRQLREALPTEGN